MRPALFATALLGLWACAPRGPEAVADKFVDYYFVEIDQGRALPLTTGLARDMIDRELRDVAAVRKLMGSMPADARPDVYYHRQGSRDEGERRVVSYDITLKHDRDVTKKRALVAVVREGSAWKVAFYQVYDGEPSEPVRPPP